MLTKALKTALIGISGWASIATAAPTLTLSDTVGDPQAVTVAPGQSFNVTLRLVADRSFTGYSINLYDANYAGAPRFTITARNRLSTNPFSDSLVADSVFSADLIDDATRDLGYTADSGSASAGTYDLENVIISVANNTLPGVYEIGFANSTILSDTAYNDVAFAPFTSYAVTVTPEPASLGGLLAFAILIRHRRRRLE